jgi:hypothetical protein
MKVKIGKYKNWIGPYQIAEKILFWMDKHEDHRVHEFGRWLSENKHGEDSLLTKVCQWIHNKQKRTVKIKLDPWDDWSADHTMALIIHPLLVQLKNSKMGAPNTEDEDVPEHLRSTAAPAKENEWDTDENWFKRWEWILDEMIWTFEQLASDDIESQFYHHEFGKNDKVPEGWQWVDGFGRVEGFWVDRPGEEIHAKRIDNGLRLFGRYYRGLWT